MPKPKAPITSRRRLDALGKVIDELYVHGESPETLWEKLLKIASSGDSEILTGAIDGKLQWNGGSGAKTLTYGSFLSRWKLEASRHEA